MPFKSRGASIPAAIGASIWGPLATSALIDTGGGSTLNLNAAGRAASTVFTVPRDGTINKVGVRVTVVNGVPPTFRFGIVTVDAATGRPTAVGAGGSAEELFAPTATGWLWVTLSTPAVLAAGAVVAAQIREGPVPPDAVNRINVQAGKGLRQTGARLPHIVFNPAGWTAGEGIGVAALYNDGTPAIPSLLDNSVAYNTTSANDEFGALFSLPFDAVCTGAVFGYGLGVGSDHNIVLYDAASNVLRQVVVSAAQLTGVTTINATMFRWAPLNLSALTNYRLTARATAGVASDVHMPFAQVNEAASRLWWPEGPRWALTSRDAGGAWNATEPLKVPMMALLLSSMSVPA